MPAFWLALTAVLGNLVKTQIGFWAMSLLSAFGLHLATQNFVVDPVLASIQSTMNGMGANALAWFSFLRVDDGVGALLSAYAAAAAMSSVRLMKKPTA